MALKYQLDSVEALNELDEAIQPLYQENNGKYILAVEGAKSLHDFDGVTKALSAERKAAKALKDQYEPWSATFKDKSPAEIQAELDRIPLLEADASGKISKEKIDAMVETTSRNRVAPVEKERDTLKSLLAERDQIIANFQAADRKRTILDAVREVAAKDPTFHESTYSSPRGALMLLSEQCLTIDETTGRVVVREDVEGIAAGLGVKDALAELKNQHPYLSKVSVGGGATGSGSGSGGPNPFKENNLQKRMEYMAGKPESEWRKLMTAAGLKSPTQLHANK